MKAITYRDHHFIFVFPYKLTNFYGEKFINYILLFWIGQNDLAQLPLIIIQKIIYRHFYWLFSLIDFKDLMGKNDVMKISFLLFLSLDWIFNEMIKLSVELSVHISYMIILLVQNYYCFIEIIKYLFELFKFVFFYDQGN